MARKMKKKSNKRENRKTGDEGYRKWIRDKSTKNKRYNSKDANK